MKYRNILFSIIALCSVSTLVFSDASDLMYKRITDLQIWSGVPASDDLIPIYDASANQVKQANANLLLGMSVESVTADNVIAASENTKTLYYASTGGIKQTLPTPESGLSFKFRIIGEAGAGASNNTLVTTSGANIIIGGINELEVDTGDDGPVSYLSAPSDTINFISTAALPGDWVLCESDGTYWFCDGQTFADGGITYASSI